MAGTNLPQGGLSADRLQHLKAVIERDIVAGRYQGAQIVVGRNGKIGLDEAIGFTGSDRGRPLRRDSVISLLSVTKAFTNVLALRAIELGQFSLLTKVSTVIAGFNGRPREDITVYHLLTHMTGLPSVFAPAPDMCIDRLDEVITAICKHVHSVEEPGRRVFYSPMAAHALLGEMVRRTDPRKRSYRQIVADEILKPLGMDDTSVGVRAVLKPRHVPPEFPAGFPARHLGHSNLGPHGAFQEQDAEMPWVGIVSTAQDIYRFAEGLRCSTESVFSPVMRELATRVHTGEHPNELYRSLAISRGWEPYPAYLGLGFSLRGDRVCHHQFGTLSSPRTFGNHGAGSTIFWVEPELGMSFACLTTGVMDEGDNVERFQRLSDIALSAAE